VRSGRPSNRPRPAALVEQAGTVGEIAHAGQDQAFDESHLLWPYQQPWRNVQFLQRPQHRAEIADAVVDDAYLHALS
jgi:hypothetical protein